MCLQAAEVSEAKRFATAKLEITVKPVDVNPPEIIATATEGYVEENSPVGTEILDVNGRPISFTVTDADLVSMQTSIVGPRIAVLGCGGSQC